MQQNVFPEAGSVYEYTFVKAASGSWSRWIDTIDKRLLHIDKNAKVSNVLISLCQYML